MIVDISLCLKIAFFDAYHVIPASFCPKISIVNKGKESTATPAAL